MATIVRINSLDYVVVGKIARYSQTPFADVFRTIGLQRREDIRTATGFVFGVPIYGFGRRRITKIDDARQILQMWDSQVMTHYESQAGLAPLRVADTSEQAWYIRGSAVFKGLLWALWLGDGGVGGQFAVVARELSSATDTAWAGGGNVDNVANTNNQGGFDLAVHKDRLVALWYDTTDHQIAFSTDGVTWTQATTDITVALLTSRAGTTDFDGGLLATVGNELVAIVYNEAAGTIQFFSSADSGVTMANEGQLIPSNSGVKGIAVYVGIDGVAKLLVGTENGVYEVDTTPATWTATLIIPIRYHVDNCVLPGNRVVAYGLKDASRVFYKGPALELSTKGGCKLTVTPNHPILTDKGWRLAQALRPGDKVVSTIGQEGMVAPDDDVTNIPPMIEEVFSSLNVVSSSDTRRLSHPVGIFDFHGDGRFMDGDVNVVLADSKLRCTCQASGLEPVHDQSLCGSDVLSHTLACFRTLGKVVETPLPTTDSSLWRFSKPPALIGSHVSQAKLHSFTPASQWNSSFLEPMANHDGAQVVTRGEGGNGLSSQVALDEVVQIREFEFSGHVYDLQTTSGLYNASGIVVHNCRRMTVHQGAVWIPVGANSGEPAGMIRYTVNGDTRLIENSVGVNGEALGLDAFDGVPSDKLGPINWLKSTGKYLLAAVGGTAASRNGHLLIHNGLGWHYLARDGTANEKLYWVDDINGTPHYAHGSATTLGVQNALVNPASGLSIARESAGILDHPEFDGGMPRYNAAWLEVYGDVINLDATTAGEYIAIAYGLNGAAASTTSLGNLLSGDLDLQFGTGGIGVSARSIQIRETFNRDAGDTSQTPTWRSMELTYFKVPPILEAWAFMIDLAETARFTSGGMETVIANLKTARDSVVKVPFVYGRMTSANVRVESPLQFEEELEEEGTIGNAARTGLVQVLVREVN